MIIESLATVCRRWLAVVLDMIVGGASFVWAHSNPVSGEAPFLSEHDEAMARMMIAMNIHPTGDVDRDFVEMMVPHHQGAIDMAEALLRYGQNETLRRLAQEFIVTKQQEIAAMRVAVGEHP